MGPHTSPPYERRLFTIDAQRDFPTDRSYRVPVRPVVHIVRLCWPRPAVSRLVPRAAVHQ